MDNYPDSGTSATPSDDSPSGTRLWPKVLAIGIVVALLVLMVVLHLTGTIGGRLHG